MTNISRSIVGRRIFFLEYTLRNLGIKVNVRKSGRRAIFCRSRQLWTDILFRPQRENLDAKAHALLRGNRCVERRSICIPRIAENIKSVSAVLRGGHKVIWAPTCLTKSARRRLRRFFGPARVGSRSRGPVVPWPSLWSSAPRDFFLRLGTK